MIQSNSRISTDSPMKVIAADMPILTDKYPVEQLLRAFQKVASSDDQVKLVLSGRRCPEEIYSVWNFVDQHDLTERVEFLPYYDRCESFPLKKQQCDVWISRNTPGDLITPDYLKKQLEQSVPCDRKYAMFFTSFHPGKQEGNSTLMRLWLDHMKQAGYITHLVYYMYDIGSVSADMRREALHGFDLYREIPVTSKLTGANYNGLNLHVDDWCGHEALDVVEKLAAEYEYDIAVTNYPFMSAIFDRLNAYTEKILLTHDSFVDRNRRMLAQGYPESGWISIDQRGEQLACDRSDVVVAMQEDEADGFRAICDPSKVQVISPIFEQQKIPFAPKTEKLKIGYFGSSNWVNEQNLGEYLKCWANTPQLREKTEILIAGGVCETLSNFVSKSLLEKVNPTFVGRVEQPGDFFSICDIVVNPERGGTGIKIKTLEALAHGMPIMTTKGGSVGLGSTNKFHLADDFASLAKLTTEIVANPKLVNSLRDECQSMYSTYLETQQKRMNELLGSPRNAEDLGSNLNNQRSVLIESKPNRSAGLNATDKIATIPEDIQASASKSIQDEFKEFSSRVNVTGLKILDIGSDDSLTNAQMFLANGAQSVVVTNSSVTIPEDIESQNIELYKCDVTQANFDESNFDVIYGIESLDGSSNFNDLCVTLKRLLKPDGVIYLQGSHLWTGAQGPRLNGDKVLQTTSSLELLSNHKTTSRLPDWAHLALSNDDLTNLLVEQGSSQSEATDTVESINDSNGSSIESHSKYNSTSELLDAMSSVFDVDSDISLSSNEPNEYFDLARKTYSEEDLRTENLRVWLTHKSEKSTVQSNRLNPKVSIVIPFYKVEPFIEDCIKSVLSQDYTNIEIIFVDDQSPDRSRAIVEKHAAKDNRIRLITHEQNQGLGPARNTGVLHSEGAYLLFLDSDDYFSNSKAVSTLVNEALSSGCQVVVGSCDRVMSDGHKRDFDREFDESHGGNPDSTVSGDQAFLGASFIPGGQYVPMRAWGTLIDRFMYLESKLEYPAAEHEDLPHTPFLYHYAKQVRYISPVVITYRDRSDSISNTGWDSVRIRRQGLIWEEIRSNLVCFKLEHLIGNSAVKTAEHLIMKLRQNGIKTGAESAVYDVLESILKDAQGDLNDELFFYMLDSLRGVLDFQKYDYNLYHKLIGNIPSSQMVKYYRHRLGTGLPDHGAVPVSTELDIPHGPTTPDTTEPESATDLGKHIAQSAYQSNDVKVQNLIKRFKKNAPKVLKKFPSMLTEGDKALYFNAGQQYQFKGSIVDAGCFIGGTTMSLVQGLLQNSSVTRDNKDVTKLIRVYDLFQIDDDYILEHLRRNYPKHDFSNESSFLGVFEENMNEYSDMLDVRPGDVIAAGYHDEQPIEILGVDLCKALPVTDFVVREFFPRLIEGALVIQQDYIHQYHPHIHLSMGLLDDYFELDTEVKWGGSVSYTAKSKISNELIEERFGTDSNWYNNIPRNESILRNLAEGMLYDENRWVMLQVLGLYYWSMNKHAKGHQIYLEAKDRFPQFDLPKEVTRMIGGASS
ncbi:MAG: glycosyltransferase [Phycisphaerales bacterium]|nr:glycosyltransferase [Phycisphaerales bacterium]